MNTIMEFKNEYNNPMLTPQEAELIMPQGFDENDKKTRDKCVYLKQLLADKRSMAQMPGVFNHLERLLDDEIVKVRSVLFQNNSRPLELPSPDGQTVTLSRKVFVPVKEHPDYNFVGRILGPRGLTAKQLEQETGCKIMVRGKGSMRDKKKEDQNRGRPNWEHLNEELHVLITVEDSENRAKIKLDRAMQEINRLLIPAVEGEDDLKKKQLMELAIINGTYRDNSNGQKIMNGHRFTALPTTSVLQAPTQIRLPNGLPIAAPILRPPMMNLPGLQGLQAAGIQGLDQPLYYAAPMGIDASSGISYTMGVNGLMNTQIDFNGQNVSPHEPTLVGESPVGGMPAHCYSNTALHHHPRHSLIINGSHQKKIET